MCWLGTWVDRCKRKKQKALECAVVGSWVTTAQSLWVHRWSTTLQGLLFWASKGGFQSGMERWNLSDARSPPHGMVGGPCTKKFGVGRSRVWHQIGPLHCGIRTTPKSLLLRVGAPVTYEWQLAQPIGVLL
jgi:hypothetical protein